MAKAISTTLTYKQVYDYIKEHNGCKLITPENEYKNTAQNIEIKCACGRHFITTFQRFKKTRTQPKQQCDVCSGHKYDLRKVQEIAKEYGCEFLSKKYTNKMATYVFKCSCGREFERSLNNFNKGQILCPQCSLGRENYSFTEEEVRNKIEGFGLKMLNPYVDAISKLKLQCPCGEIFEISYNKMIGRKKIRCNKCTKSKSNIEILAELYLKNNNIDFASQYTFNDLKTTKNTCLRFDLAIMKDEHLVCLIELDGQQHYKIHRTFAPTEEDLKWIQARDEMKNQYCKDKNLHLYRIPYWKFNHINEELEKILKQENLVPSSN